MAKRFCSVSLVCFFLLFLIVFFPVGVSAAATQPLLPQVGYLDGSIDYMHLPMALGGVGDYVKNESLTSIGHLTTVASKDAYSTWPVNMTPLNPGGNVWVNTIYVPFVGVPEVRLRAGYVYSLYVKTSNGYSIGPAAPSSVSITNRLGGSLGHTVFYSRPYSLVFSVPSSFAMGDMYAKVGYSSSSLYPYLELTDFQIVCHGEATDTSSIVSAVNQVNASINSNTNAVNDNTAAVVDQGEQTRETIENQYNTDAAAQAPGVVNGGAGAAGDVGGILDSGAGDTGSLFSGTDQPAQLVFPAFSMEIGGVDYQFWDDQLFSFSSIEEGFPALMVAVRLVLVASVYLLLLAYLHRVYVKIFGGD
jgi:hypothetical protein